MSLAQCTAQNPISLGVIASNGGTLNENFDIGNSYGDFVIYGTVKEGGIERKIKFSDLGKITLTGDGQNIMTFNSGYELYVYLTMNGFNHLELSSTENGSDTNVELIHLPQYRNVNSNVQQQLTYVDTGLNEGQFRVLNLQVDILANNADTNNALTDANLHYQAYTTALTGSSARLSVASYQFNVGGTGQIDFADIPRVGVIGQIMLIPPVNVSAVAEGVQFDDFKVVISNQEVTTIISDTIKSQIEASDWRNLPHYGYKNQPSGRMGSKIFSVFDMTMDGFGADPAGDLAALGLTNENGVTSFRLRIDVKNKGTDSDPKLLVITQNIIG